MPSFLDSLPPAWRERLDDLKAGIENARPDIERDIARAKAELGPAFDMLLEHRRREQEKGRR